MICGFTRGNGAMSLLALALLAAAPAVAQDAVCTLPFAVPAAADIDVALESNVRGLGLRLTWPAPDNAISTCYALLDTSDLNIAVDVTGDYADAVDRMLRFTFADSGMVGTPARNRLVVAWENMNRSRTGSIAGEINLSNDGGLWRYDVGAQTWAQQNEGLPRFLSYLNFDAFAQGPGSSLGAISSGNQPGITPRGLYRRVGDGPWQEVAPETFGRAIVIKKVAIDPDNDANFAVGTNGNGVFLTADGGQSFTRWAPYTNPVSALTWSSSRLYAGITGRGLFATVDGVNWTEYATLRVPANLDNPGDPPALIVPQITGVVEDASDPSHIYALLRDHALWHSTDAGATWASLGGDWIVSDPDRPGAWRYTGSSLFADPGAAGFGDDRLVVGTARQGLWYSTDGGQHWLPSATPTDSLTTQPDYVGVVASGGALFAQANGFGLVRSEDAGATFAPVPDQLADRNALTLTLDAAGNLLVPTWGGGIYLPGTVVPLSETILPGQTDDIYDNLQLGLSIAFGPGEVYGDDSATQYPGQQFRLNAQNFQGWIVWRADRDRPDEMTMIGRYDKNNPESCIEGFCGDDSYVILPNCFGERRAACFDFSVPGQISFFDGDVYNGFSYYYAVTPYDYGDVSMVTDPVSLATPLVHPNRFPDDPVGSGDGVGNRFVYEVDQPPASAVDGNEIYVFPNPLRRDAGIVGGEGEEVRWANLPPDSRIEVYSLAGDKIADLSGESQHEGNMYWVTRNDDGQLLASGIYIWRCIMPERNDFWGKLVIIR